MDERRIWDRKVVKIQAKYRFVDFAQYRSCQILDINHTGLLMKTEAALQEQQEIRLVVRIPLQGEIYLSAIVCWTKMDKEQGFLAGVKFQVWGMAEEESISKLYAFCSSL